LDLNDLLGSIQNGAAGSFIMTWLGPRIIERDFKTGGMIKYIVKDLEIALDECRRMNIS